MNVNNNNDLFHIIKNKYKINMIYFILNKNEYQ